MQRLSCFYLYKHFFKYLQLNERRKKGVAPEPVILTFRQAQVASGLYRLIASTAPLKRTLSFPSLALGASIGLPAPRRHSPRQAEFPAS
jgi:hypothetical protein